MHDDSSYRSPLGTRDRPPTDNSQASRQRKHLIGIQLVLQGLVILLLAVQLILSSSDSYDVVTSAPVFSMDWQLDDFAKNVWGMDRPVAGLDGKIYFNLQYVAFETNLTKTPKICLAKPEMCLRSLAGDVPSLDIGSLTRRFVLPLDEFTQYFQDAVSTVASKQLLTVYRHIPDLLGLARTDAPWYYDLAVNSQGHACGDIYEYAYSYGAPSGLLDCNRVWVCAHPRPRPSQTLKRLPRPHTRARPRDSPCVPATSLLRR